MAQQSDTRTKKWIEDNIRVNGFAMDLSADEIAESELRIVRFYVFKHLHRRRQVVEDGIFALIQQFSYPLIIQYINAREISNCTLSPKKMNYKNCKYAPAPDKTGRNIIKCVVLGAGTVGKSAVLVTYTTGEFPGYFVDTVFEPYSKSFMVDSVEWSLVLFDTAGVGDNPFARARPIIYPKTDIFLVCMDVLYADKRKYNKDDRLIAKQIDTLAFVQEVRALCGDEVPICIAGMKTDLRNDPQYAHLCWSKEEMENFAYYECGCNNYMECSSKNNEGLDELFDFVVRGGIDCSVPRIQKLKDKKNCIIL